MKKLRKWKVINLTQDKQTIVDDEDFVWLNSMKWMAHKEGKNNWYAVRSGSRKEKPRKFIKMHRLILGLEDPEIKTDHINGNGLDNRRCNLRTCNNRENIWNSKAHCDGVSKYKGVGWHKLNKKWEAAIKIDGRIKHLGSFDDEIEAAKTYDKVAKKYQGEFAYLNFLDDVEEYDG